MERDGSSSHHGVRDNSSLNSENTLSDNKDNLQTLPSSSLQRLMRQIVPQNTRVSDEAKEIVRNYVVGFIRFMTDEANEHCEREHRRIIVYEDLIWAMSKVGFDNYVELLNAYRKRIQDNNAAAVVEGMVGFQDGLGGASGSDLGRGGASSEDDGEAAGFDPPLALLDQEKFL